MSEPFFVHSHEGCLDANGKCHAFCYRTEVVYTDGSLPPKTISTCPDEEAHPGPLLDLRRVMTIVWPVEGGSHAEKEAPQYLETRDRYLEPTDD